MLAGVGYLAYHQATLPGAVDAYEKLADAWARGDRAEAMRFAAGDGVARSLERKPLNGLMTATTVKTLRGTKYAILSSTQSQDGDTVIQADQSVLFDPPGAKSRAEGGAMTATFRHSATVRKTPAGWKVVTFDPAFLQVGPTGQR